MSKFCPACGGTATQPRPGCTNDKHADYGYCADCLEPLTAHAGDCPAVVPHPRDVDIPGREFEMARVADPERAWWDDFTDGGLEGPGEDEF